MDAAYIGVVLFWILLGVYWLGRYAVLEGHHPAWGLAFLLLPATLTSIDRMTADVALAALCVAFVLYSKERSSAGLYLVLLLAPLVRETGALLLAEQCAHDAAAIRWRRAAVFATAILPAAAWYESSTCRCKSRIKRIRSSRPRESRSAIKTLWSDYVFNVYSF